MANQPPFRPSMVAPVGFAGTIWGSDRLLQHRNLSFKLDHRPSSGPDSSRCPSSLDKPLQVPATPTVQLPGLPTAPPAPASITLPDETPIPVTSLTATTSPQSPSQTLDEAVQAQRAASPIRSRPPSPKQVDTVSERPHSTSSNTDVPMPQPNGSSTAPPFPNLIPTSSPQATLYKKEDNKNWAGQNAGAVSDLDSS